MPTFCCGAVRTNVFREEMVIFAIQTRTITDATMKSFIFCKKKDQFYKGNLTNVLSKSKAFITYLIRWEYHQKRNSLTNKSMVCSKTPF